MTVVRHSHHRHHRNSWKKRMTDAWASLSYRRKRTLIKILVGVGMSLMAVFIGAAITLFM